MIARWIPYILLTTSTSLVHTSHLIPRESIADDYDPYIICEGPGPTYEEGLPRSYSEDSYYLNLYLCSVAHGIPRHNVGCACTSSRSLVRCSESVADPILYNAIYRSTNQWEVSAAMDRGFEDGRMPFSEYCWDNCLCVDPQTAAESNANNSIALSVLHRYRVGQLSRQRAGTIQFNPFTGGAVVTSGSGQSSQTHGHAIQTQCGNNCTSNNDCKAPPSATGSDGLAVQSNNCTCRAQSSQYQPGSGLVAFVAACLIDMATGGKRGEELPCPCNSSYVSHGCCGANDGWVWEAPELKLGELVN